MLYEIRFGTDGIGLPFGNVFADDMAEARELAAEKLRAENFHVQADGGLFTVHGHEKWAIFRIQAGLYAHRIDDFRENRPELTSAGTVPETSDIGTGFYNGQKTRFFATTADEAAELIADVGTEIHKRTERLVRDLKLPGTATGRFPAQPPLQTTQLIGRVLRDRPTDHTEPSQEMIDSIGQGDVYDDAPEFNRPPGPDEFDASGYARRVIEAFSNSVPLDDSERQEALRDEIPYEGDGFGIRYDR